MTLLVLALAAVPAFAQEQVTVVRRDSSRFTGRFEAWARNTNLIYVRVSQNDQQRVPLNDVLVMEVGGPAQNLPANETDAARGGEHVLVLTSGEILRGRLLNIEGGEGSDTPNEPRVVSFKPSNGDERRVRMSEMRRFYSGNYPQAGVAAPAPAPAPAPAGAIRVAANQRWVSTGIVLGRGDQVQFESSGQIQLSGDGEDKAGTAGSMRGRRAPGAPLPDALAGALIGRVGNGPVFGIGNMTGPLSPPGNGGELVLGVNDDELSDNQGAFDVTVRLIRRR
jgi:hypothetical protein